MVFNEEQFIEVDGVVKKRTYTYTDASMTGHPISETVTDLSAADLAIQNNLRLPTSVPIDPLEIIKQVDDVEFLTVEKWINSSPFISIIFSRANLMVDSNTVKRIKLILNRDEKDISNPLDARTATKIRAILSAVENKLRR